MKDVTPSERVKRLRELIAEKEKKKKQLKQEEEATESELEEVKELIESELESLREDEEVKLLLERIELLESQGKSDEIIQAELNKRGVPKSMRQLALQLHSLEHPEHEFEIDRYAQEDLESLLRDAPGGGGGGNSLYKTPGLENKPDLYSSTDPDDLYKRGPEAHDVYQSDAPTYQRTEPRQDAARKLGKTGLDLGDEYLNDDY